MPAGKALGKGSAQAFFFIIFFENNLCREPEGLALGKEGFAECLAQHSAKYFYFFLVLEAEFFLVLCVTIANYILKFGTNLSFFGIFN